jgi:hypothetical protein
MLFFVNPAQPSTLLNQVAHFATLARGVLVRGAGVDVVYA